MKYAKNIIMKSIDRIFQYRKVLSVHLKYDVSRIHFRIFRILKAHLYFGIDPLLYSFFQLDNVPESEWNEYEVDQKRFNKLISGNSSIEDRRVAGNKLRFYIHCTENDLPIIPILCAISNDTSFNNKGIEVVSDIKKWREIMSKFPNELFIKPYLGSSGKGAFAVYRKGRDLKFLGYTGTVDDLFRYLKERIQPGKGYIVQPRMKTHSSLKMIVSHKGLSTVRLTTVRSNGNTNILFACLKIVRGQNEHDNFSKGMSNNLIVPINVKTGELGAAWGSTMSDWPMMHQYIVHPDTGERIQSFLLPFWYEIKELAIHAQDTLPLLQTIGWDIALTDEGIFIVEANTAYDPVLPQLLQQRGLKSEYEKIFNTNFPPVWDS